jgi:hypothetical protein
MATKIAAPLPERRYLSREEASRWLGLSVETFDRLTIPYCDFGPRSRRWDVFDIIAFANENKTCDGAQNPAPIAREKGQRCDSTSTGNPPIGGFPGTTRTAGDIAEVLELPIRG